MGRKIFVSYKYADDTVKNLKSTENSTVRSYVDKLESYLADSEHYYKGESDGEDLSQLEEETIWNKLKDRIYDSSLTIVMISPNMKENGKEDKNQWIPWEISYSLKATSRKTESGKSVTSKPNAILAIVLPDNSNSYEYYIKDNICCSEKCRTLKTNTLFKILKNNMFNIIEEDARECDSSRKIYYGESSYIYSVKWKDFIKNPDKYIESSYIRLESIEEYEIKKLV